MFHLIAPPQEDRREPPPPSPSCAAAEPDPLPPPLAAEEPSGVAPEAADAGAADDLTAPPAERPPPAKRSRPVGLVVSLIIHLLILALLIDWPQSRPIEVTPIPVQLVLEPPPAPTPAPPKPETKPPAEVKPPPGRLASEEIGNPEAKPADAAKDETAAPPEPQKQKPAEPAVSEKPKQTAAIAPPPEPPKPEPAKPEPKPAPPKEERAAKPPAKAQLAAVQPPRRPENRAQSPQRRGVIPGPAASRSEYLAYLASLVRRHINLLPLAVVAGRSGETIIDILVLDDGTIAMLRVGRSSGYPDIDVRIEKMIAAVGRFPPLPQWFQGPSMLLEFRLKFPEALVY